MSSEDAEDDNADILVIIVFEHFVVHPVLAPDPYLECFPWELRQPSREGRSRIGREEKEGVSHSFSVPTGKCDQLER
jgi:hypothetical protein